MADFDDIWYVGADHAERAAMNPHGCTSSLACDGQGVMRLLLQFTENKRSKSRLEIRLSPQETAEVAGLFLRAMGGRTYGSSS